MHFKSYRKLRASPLWTERKNPNIENRTTWAIVKRYSHIGDGASKRQRPKTKMNLMKLSTLTKCQWIKLFNLNVGTWKTWHAHSTRTRHILCCGLFCFDYESVLRPETRAITIECCAVSIDCIVLFSYTYIHKSRETRDKHFKCPLWVAMSAQLNNLFNKCWSMATYYIFSFISHTGCARLMHIILMNHIYKTSIYIFYR